VSNKNEIRVDSVAEMLLFPQTQLCELLIVGAMALKALNTDIDMLVDAL